MRKEFVLLSMILSLLERPLFADNRDDHLMVSKEDFEALSRRNDLLKNIPDAYRMSAFGIEDFYKCTDRLLEADAAGRRAALFDLLILISEGKIDAGQRKYLVYTQISSATYFANLTKRPQIVSYFHSSTRKIVEILRSGNELEGEIALRILQNMFPGSQNRSSEWFRDRLFDEDPLARLWVAVGQGKNVIYPQDLE
jgi:hypothetical protein